MAGRSADRKSSEKDRSLDEDRNEPTCAEQMTAHLEQKLDEALADTFPASDPIQLTEPSCEQASELPKRD